MIINKKVTKIFLLFIFLFSTLSCFAQNVKQDSVENSPRIVTIYGGADIPTVYVKGKRKSRRGIYRNTDKLERIIRKVYPIALEGNITLMAIEKEMMTYKTEKERKAYIKKMEKAVLTKYKPVLKTLTMSEGLVLLKLIDRQTGNTSYELVKELRGGFSAVFWQGIGRLFRMNLKDEYDGLGGDQLIEYYIQKYERENKR